MSNCWWFQAGITITRSPRSLNKYNPAVVMGSVLQDGCSGTGESLWRCLGTLPHPRPQLSLEIIEEETGKRTYFNLGPHPPRLWPEDMELLHSLWLELSEKGLGHKLHHRDVVRVALQRLQIDLRSQNEKAVIRDVKKETSEDRRPNDETPEFPENPPESDTFPKPADL